MTEPILSEETKPESCRKNLMEQIVMLSESRPKHLVNRKKYLWLCLLGVLGVHRFYEHRWILGIVYLALSWTGISFALSFVDWMIALPKQADENGMILL